VQGLPLLVEAGYGCLVLLASNVFAIANHDFYVQKKIMQPYEWGILDVKGLDFYAIFNCADCSHCSCCCGGFCGSTGINCHNFPIALG
jgi:hypothetical protein